MGKKKQPKLEPSVEGVTGPSVRASAARAPASAAATLGAPAPTKDYQGQRAQQQLPGPAVQQSLQHELRRTRETMGEYVNLVRQLQQKVATFEGGRTTGQTLPAAPATYAPPTQPIQAAQRGQISDPFESVQLTLLEGPTSVADPTHQEAAGQQLERPTLRGAAQRHEEDYLTGPDADINGAEGYGESFDHLDSELFPFGFLLLCRMNNPCSNKIPPTEGQTLRAQL
jgi:hypothetical protein